MLSEPYSGSYYVGYPQATLEGSCTLPAMHVQASATVKIVASKIRTDLDQIKGLCTLRAAYRHR